MTTFHVLGLIGILGCLCLMAVLWLADNAPLVDEHEQLIADEDMPSDLPVSREGFSQ